MAGKVFWLVALGVLVTLGLIAKGYDLLLAAFALLLIALICLKLSLDKGERLSKEIKNELSGRLTSLDTIVQDLTKAFKDQADVKEFTLGALEKTKNEIRAEVKESIDKMAKKAIDIENNLNQMKRTFSAAFASLDDRLRALEPKIATVSPSSEIPQEFSPELKMQGAEDSYVEIGPERSAE